MSGRVGDHCFLAWAVVAEQSKYTHRGFEFVMSATGRGPTYCFRDGLCACAKFWNRLCVGIFWPLGGQLLAHIPLGGQVWTPLCASTWPPGGQVPAHRPLGGQVWAPLKLNCVHFSLCLHAPNFLEVPETCRNIFRPLGRWWHTCGQSASAQKLGWVEQIHGGDGKVNISASFRAPWTKFFLRFLRCKGICLDHLGGVDTPVDRVLAPKTGLNWANTCGRWGGQYPSFY